MSLERNVRNMRFEFSAGGIIYKGLPDKKFELALILDPYGKWTFPKGRIEKGEKPDLAAKREVQEELGITELEVIRLLEKIDYWFKEGDVLIHKFVYFYLMRTSKETVLKAQSSEIKDAKWFGAKEALSVLGYKKDNEALLEKAMELIKSRKK